MSLFRSLFGGGRAPDPASRALVANTSFAVQQEQRRELAELAGPLLAPLYEAILDARVPPRVQNDRKAALDLPELSAIVAADPVTRGQLFVRTMDIERMFPRPPLQRWGQLTRPMGEFRTDSHDFDLTYIFDAVRGALLKRAIVIPDADMARLVADILDHRIYLWGTGKPAGNVWRSDAFLRVLCSVAADPDAHRTRAALAALLAQAPSGQQTELPVEWRIAASAAIGLRDTIRPPRLDITHNGTPEKLGRHFTNIADPAFHDEAHRELLSGVVSAADAMPEADPKLLTPFGGPHYQRKVERETALRCKAAAQSLQRELAVIGPFVADAPDGLKALGSHCAGLDGKAAPSARWRSEARRLVAALPDGLAQRLFAAMLAGIRPEPPYVLASAELLRGLIYLAADWPAREFGAPLADFALGTCYQTVPGVGMRSEKLGNACLWTLINLPNGGGVPHLARLLARVKYPKVRAKLNAALNEAAAAAGISRGALDELSVPGHGLDAAGVLVLPVGDGQAVLRLAGNVDVDIAWTNADGKTVKAPTAAMKADKEALAEAKTLAKEIAADLGTQPIRLQRLYLEARDWPLDEWQARYRDHPLVGGLARRLLWWFDCDGRRIAVLPAADALTDVTGKAVAKEGGRIALWHPIDADPAEVLAWRDRLEALGIVQPFAQVWREIYRVTDAERATRTYSNRWAGHILKQHQFMTLARLNGWTVTHRMWVDAPNDAPAHLMIPAHNLVADYWVEGAGGQEAPEVLDSGAYVYVNTDRLAFHRIAPGALDSAYGPERLGDVGIADLPPIVLSEVMRHCDLFTAVASIAADPMWRDRGVDAAHPNQWSREANAYWDIASFGPMSEAAKMRRAVLERLVPKLAIADQLSLDDQALRVQGRRHLYRIHIGSAAVQIVSQSRHVCIVPATGQVPAIHLPFEGDRTLSLILSKAVLLAADDRITDPGIAAQL